MGDEGSTDVATLAADLMALEPNKRARVDVDGRDLKRVAEIVMVLAAMGQMRSGRDPTAAEKGMGAEAREKLAEICETVKLSDLFTKEAAKVVVNDLGLNQSKEDMLGIRPGLSQSKDGTLGVRPRKMTIAEKFLHTKRKMEEAKESATQSSTRSSPLLPMGFGGKSENRATLFHGAHRFLPDKASPMPLSSGGFQAGSSVCHIPALASAASLLKPSQVNEIQQIATPTKSLGSSVEWDSSSLALPRLEATHFRLDPRTNMLSYLLPVQEKDPTTSSVQSASVIEDQDSKSSVTQAAPGSLHNVHQPSHGTNYVAAPNEIAKNVQKFLQPKVSDQQNWTPPSTEYMTTPLNCLVCKITINDMDSLLVCDSCEKGTHLKCLMAYNQRGIPKVEWHCQKCLMSSCGKPLPPKFGRVTRSIGISKASSNAGGSHVSLQKRAENMESKVNYQKMFANGNAGVSNLSRTFTLGSDHIESTPDMTVPNSREVQGIPFSATRIKMESKGSCKDLSKEKTAAVCVSSGAPNGNSNQNSQNNGLFPCVNQRPTSDSILQLSVGLEHSCVVQASGSTVEINHQSQAPSDSAVIKNSEVPHSAMVSANPPHELRKPMAEELKGSAELREASDHESGSDIRRELRDNSHATSTGTLDSVDGARDCCRPPIADLRSVEWVGDILHAVDGQTYYQSCRVNGEVYNLQDHVLIFSSNHKFLPSKVQVLWEDNKAGSKWAIVNHCYFPSDLPEEFGRPSTPVNNEVYESHSQSTILAGSIHGLCKVLPLNKFKEESERRKHLGEISNGLHPVFLCRWFYDESKGLFKSTAE